MDYFTTNSQGKYHAIRLDKGDDLLACFQTFLKQNKITDGAVVSGIGTLDQCCMHFVTTIDDPSKMEFKKWHDTPLEVASISGIVANGEPHLHMVISDTDRAWGGHVEPGCRTLYLCEIMFIETANFDLDRVRKSPDPSDPDHLIKNLIQK